MTSIDRFWFMTVNTCRVRFIPAEPPCMKGEIQVLWFVFGWQR